MNTAEENSICIIDFCGQSPIGPISFCADYWPKDKRVVFGLDWYDIPEMPWDKTREPTEDEVNHWVEKNKGWLQKEFENNAESKRVFELRINSYQKIYEEKGSNSINIEFLKPNGSTKIVSQFCGVRSKAQMEEVISKLINDKNSEIFGAKVVKLEFDEKITEQDLVKYGLGALKVVDGA